MMKNLYNLCLTLTIVSILMINQILSIDTSHLDKSSDGLNVNKKYFMPITRSRRYASPYGYDGYYGSPVYYQQPIYYTSSYYNPLSAFCLFCARPSGFSFIEVG
uniref:Secreted protein n=1 Tax=Strongyloides papillosus TaxID=174720 RepID=A0A0N5CDR9_STREA